ncbi:V-set domain-containing T-cell activation inhibitor 1-like [Pagrus major]|uniref:V-set domain-containing T-cell activation inhibitor 1-like n=1 Tax=Pagrus major TaxID=143350 RepID=UPI003CC8B226
MELLPLVCLCLLSCSGETSAAGDGVKVVVKEDDDAVLPCSLSNKEDITGQAFDWKKDESQKEVFFHDAAGHTNQGPQFIDRVSHFQDQMMNGNASIKIRKTKMADSGNYSCIFPHPEPRQTFIIELVVGAAPKPFVTILDQTKDWSLLQCEAHGDPLPTVEWKDSDNKTLPADSPKVSERGGRSYITVKTTVTKADNYSCVATQETISHRIGSEIFVHLAGAASKPSVTSIKSDDGTVLQCEVLGASPKPKVEWKDSSGNILPVKDLKVTERGDSYDIVLQAALTKTDNFRCVVTQEEIGHQTGAETYVPLDGGARGGNIAALDPLVTMETVASSLSLSSIRGSGLRSAPCLEARELPASPSASSLPLSDR